MKRFIEINTNKCILQIPNYIAPYVPKDEPIDLSQVIPDDIQVISNHSLELIFLAPSILFGSHVIAKNDNDMIGRPCRMTGRHGLGKKVQKYPHNCARDDVEQMLISNAVSHSYFVPVRCLLQSVQKDLSKMQ